MKNNTPHNANPHRIAQTASDKNVPLGDKEMTTYYVRDPQGNVLAVYERKRGETGNGTLTLAEQHLYGAGRLGMRKRDLALNGTNTSETPATYYELTNHLGNVMAVISDKASDTNEPTVVSLSDYYPFGMTEPGRNYTRPSDDYRFGYTGHEKESDLAEGVYTTEFRLLDTRLGKWLSVDPLFVKYPNMSSYNYCHNIPILMIDPNGLEDYYNTSGEFICAGPESSDNGRYVIRDDWKANKLSKFINKGGTLTKDNVGKYNSSRYLLPSNETLSEALNVLKDTRNNNGGAVEYASSVSRDGIVRKGTSGAPADFGPNYVTATLPTREGDEKYEASIHSHPLIWRKRDGFEPEYYDACVPSLLDVEMSKSYDFNLIVGKQGGIEGICKKSDATGDCLKNLSGQIVIDHYEDNRPFGVAFYGEITVNKENETCSPELWLNEEAVRMILSR